jgi:hypothetical protein
MPQIQDTQARIDMYVNGESSGAVAQFFVPYTETTNSEDTTKQYRYWAAFCFSGLNTLNKIYTIDSLMNTRPNITTCEFD